MPGNTVHARCMPGDAAEAPESSQRHSHFSSAQSINKTDAQDNANYQPFPARLTPTAHNPKTISDTALGSGTALDEDVIERSSM